MQLFPVCKQASHTGIDPHVDIFRTERNVSKSFATLSFIPTDGTTTAAASQLSTKYPFLQQIGACLTFSHCSCIINSLVHSLFSRV